MLYILLQSSIWTLQGRILYKSKQNRESNVTRALSEYGDSIAVIHQAVATRLAAPQAVLALLAFSTYHVQIITRLSSGYPVWYWWLASLILGDQRVTFRGREFSAADSIIRWMVMYAVVQGGLFANFLPPA